MASMTCESRERRVGYERPRTPSIRLSFPSQRRKVSTKPSCSAVSPPIRPVSKGASMVVSQLRQCRRVTVKRCSQTGQVISRVFIARASQLSIYLNLRSRLFREYTKESELVNTAFQNVAVWFQVAEPVPLVRGFAGVDVHLESSSRMTWGCR